jgi:hypothetical protein
VKQKIKKGIAHKERIASLNDLTTHSLQIGKASDFSLLKMQDFPQTYFVPRHHS